MTGGAESSTASRVQPKVMAAAIGLAAELFPIDGGGTTWTTTREQVLFLLDGHVAEWSGWSESGAVAERRRRQCARLLKRRVNDLANPETAGVVLDRLLRGGAVSGCRLGEDYQDGVGGRIVVDAGMPLAAFVDAALDELDDLHAARRRCRRPATAPGTYQTSIRVPGVPGTDDRYVEFRFELQPHHQDPGGPLPEVADSPPLTDLVVPFGELAEIAERLDAHPDLPGTHRAEAVEKFRTSIRSRDTATTDGLRLTAGELNSLLAYTGFGKSVVLVDVFACWTMARGIVVGFALPTNADVGKVTHQIERAATALGLRREIVALTSPRSRIKVAEEIAETGAETATRTPTGTGPDADWAWDRFGYGCALAAVATGAGGVDGWVPGNEPCAKLREPRPARTRTRTFACPWRTTCGRFRASRAACTADVIVTSHVNLLLGVVQTPVRDDRRRDGRPGPDERSGVGDGSGVDDRLSVEELLLRRCQILVIDEVDMFQRTAIEQAGRGLLLDQAGHTTTHLRALDEDFGAAFGRLHDDVDANVRDAYFGLRYLSENYVSHLAYERLGPARGPKERRRQGPGRAWILPRRRDNWLTAHLFGVEPDQVTDEQSAAFRSLFDGRVPPRQDEPAGFDAARRQLNLVAGTGFAGATIRDARHALGALVPDLSDDGRREFIDGMLRRAILERVRLFLHRLMANNAQLVDIDVRAAREIADALGVYGQWRVTPYGPLGRLMFAFTEYYDDTGVEPARLATAAFGGDPHTYAVGLGDVTALAHAGTRRIVLGLSATSYFPLAPHHHLHVRPRWWVRDDAPGTVRVEPATVPEDDADGDGPGGPGSGRSSRGPGTPGRSSPQRGPARISGRRGTDRENAIRRIARQLWSCHLAGEFARLAREDPQRQRVLLATTSYAAARHVAEGLADAGVSGPRICLAVPPNSDTSGEQRWRELPADRLERFPSLPGADILVAPLARVHRGINIIGVGSRSALGSVWLVIRPIPIIDEPAELMAHVQAGALSEHPGPVGDPVALLARRRAAARESLEKILRAPPYFQSQPEPVQLGVAAEIILGAIQLIGRARRGGTPAVLHLVDGAFQTGVRNTDLPVLINRLVARWRPEQLRDMREYYGSTLDAFLDYAARNGGGPPPR